MPAHSKTAKRSAQVQAAEEMQPQKRVRQDPLMVGVVDAIQQAADLPESCRAMLAAAVPGCLGTAMGDRHEHQAAMVSWIGEVVDGLRAKLQAELDAADAEAADAHRAKEGLLTTVGEAKVALAGEEESTTAKEVSVKESEEAVDLARARLTEAQEAQRQGDAGLVEARKDKCAVEAALGENLRLLRDAEGFQPEEAPRHLEVLMPIAQRLALEDSLLAALPTVSARYPNDRGAFDHMVLEQLDGSLQGHIAKLAAELEAGAQGAQERAAAVAAAQAELDAAEEALRAATAAQGTAHAQRQQAADALKAAEGAVEAFDQARKATVAAREEKEAALQNFTGYNVECFNMLRDRAATAGA